MRNFALKFPGVTGQITPPPNVPSGGLFPGGEQIIQVGITIFLVIIVLLAFFYILWGAIRLVISAGDKQQVKEAREKITYAVIGIIVAFFAFLIINTAGHFFNVPLIATIGIPGLGPTSTPAPDTLPPTVSVGHSPVAPTTSDPVIFVIGVTDESSLESGKTKLHIIEGVVEFVHTCVPLDSACSITRGPYAEGTSVRYWGEATDIAGNRGESPFPMQGFTVDDAASIPTPTPHVHLLGDLVRVLHAVAQMFA